MLKLKNITKYYNDYPVLKSVNLEVQRGEIHGLVGENGAGKSTLLNIIMGAASIHNSGGFQGEVWLDGCRVSITDPTTAIELGIGMVHQEFALFPSLTVAENIFSGREAVFPALKKLGSSALALIDWQRTHAQAQQILNQLGMYIDSRLTLGELSVSSRQFIELAREISKESLRVLILDEPTAALGTDDADRLLRIVQEISEQGCCVIFVSHRLEEVMSICHRISVLRDGEIVACYEPDNYSVQSIAESIVGRVVSPAQNQERNITTNRSIMRCQNFSVSMPGEMLYDLNLDIHQGEILGLAGLSGHGKLAFGNGLMGLYPSSGYLEFDGLPLNPASSYETITRGISFLPEERRGAGLLLKHSIMDNIIFTALQNKKRFLVTNFIPALSVVNKQEARAYARKMVNMLDIRCRSIYQQVGWLSGGNQQKVCLARALALQPELLVVAEPTRGIDIGAKELILEFLIKINRELGTTIIIASSELGELKRVCDRILVLYEGKMKAILSPQSSELDFALAFSGEWNKSLCS